MKLTLKTLHDQVGGVDDRLGNVEISLKTLHDHVERVDDRLGSLDDRLGSLDDRVGNLEIRLDEIFEAINLYSEKLGHNFSNHEIRISALENINASGI